MHVLFNWENPHSIPSTISVAAIKAAESVFSMLHIWVDEVKWQKRLNPLCKCNKVHVLELSMLHCKFDLVLYA